MALSWWFLDAGGRHQNPLKLAEQFHIGVCLRNFTESRKEGPGDGDVSVLNWKLQISEWDRHDVSFLAWKSEDQERRTTLDAEQEVEQEISDFDCHFELTEGTLPAAATIQRHSVCWLAEIDDQGSEVRTLACKVGGEDPLQRLRYTECFDRRLESEGSKLETETAD